MTGSHTMCTALIVFAVLFVAGVQAQPQLTSFALNVTPPEQLTLTFTAQVIASSCNVQELTLQNSSVFTSGGAYTPQMGNCSYGSGTNVVGISLGDSDWGAIQGNIYLATSNLNTYLSMGSNFIDDVNATNNIPISPSSALQVFTFVANINPPLVLSGTLDLNSGTLEIVLSEGVLLNQFNASGFSINFSTTMEVISLSGAADVTAVTLNSHIVISLLSSDVNTFKTTGSFPFTLSVAAGSFVDASSLQNIDHSEIPANFVPDTTRPQLNEFQFDLDSGSVTLLFNEPITTGSINFNDIYITSMLQNLPGGYPLSNSSVSSTANSFTLIVVTLATSVLNGIKADPQACTSLSDCVLFLTNSSLTDVSGNPLIQSSILPSLFTADSTQPQLSSFALNLNTGTLVLTFSEAMDVTSFDSLGVTFFSSRNSQSQGIVLRDAVVSTVGVFNSVLMTTVGSNTFNQLKLLISNGTGEIYLSIQNLTISDTAGNLVLPIPVSSAIMVSVFTADMTPPTLLRFTPSRPDQRQLILLFDEYVDVSTWDVTQLTLTLTTSQGTFTHDSFMQGIITTSDSDNVTFEFSMSEFVSPFSEQFTEAFNTGSISLTASSGLVEDLFGIRSVAVTTPLTFNGTQTDLIRPRLVSFSLDLNSGGLQLTFSETVRALTIAGNTRFQNSADLPAHVYTLTSNGSFSQNVTTGQVLTFMITTSDLNNIKLNSYLATAVDNTYLVLLETFAEDMTRNRLMEETAIQASTVVSDTVSPQVVRFNLDLDSNILSLQMNEPVQISTFDGTRISLTNSSNPGAGESTRVQLTRVEVIASGNATSFRLLLGVNDTINIKREPLCYSEVNCFATFAASLVRDVSNNPSTESASPIQVTTLLSDVTPPRLVAFPEFDLDAGTFTFIFSEPVNGSSTDFTDVQFGSTRSNPPISVTLSEGFTTPDHIEINFHMSRQDLNMLKLYPDLCTLIVNCWVRLPSFFITDIDANPFLHSNFEPDAQASFHQPLSFIPDTTPPALESFSINMTQGALTLSFTEVIAEISFDPADLTLLNAPLGTVSRTLSHQSTYLRSTTGTDITVNITLSDLNWLKAHSLYTSPADSYLTFVTNLIDISGNNFQNIETSNAMQVGRFTPDMAQPKLASFDLFNIDNGSFIITFNEPVDANTVNFHMIALLGTSSGFPRYTLSGGSVQSLNASKLSLLITLSHNDRVQLKLSNGIATSYTSTYISVAEGMVQDTTGNANEAIQAIQLLRSGFISDTSFASLVSFSLDLNLGILTFTFDDVINANTFDPTKLTIQSAPHSPTIFYTLTAQSRVSTPSSDIIAVSIHEQDLHALQLNLQLATNASNTYLSFPSDVIMDIEGKNITERTNSQAIAVSNYTEDLTSPVLQSYQLDMNTGQINFTFSEPVLVASVLPDEIVIQNSSNDSAVVSTLRLNGSTLNLSAATSLTATICINYSDLNLLKSLRELATGISDTFISFGSGFAEDANRNRIEPATSIRVAIFLPDVTQPQLVQFDVNLRSLGRLTLQFSEAIWVTDAAQATLALQNTASNPTTIITLTSAETITNTGLDQIEIGLTPEHTNQLLIDASIASSVDSFFITISQGGVLDFNNNPVVVVPSSEAQRARYFYKACFSDSTNLLYNNIMTGTCDPCSSVCVGGCSGPEAIAGEGGCDLCATIVLDREVSTRDIQNCLLESNCSMGYFSSTNATLTTSLPNLVPNGTICQPCDSLCSICTGPGVFNCQACKYAFLLKEQNGPIAQCLPSSMGIQSDLYHSCHVQCNGCSGPTNQDCVSCQENHLVVDGIQMCVPNCSDSAYLAQSGNGEYECQMCNRQCIDCIGPSNSDCVHCRSVNYTTNGSSECIETCPDNFFESAGSCNPCHDQCIGCSGPTSRDCTECLGDSIEVSTVIMECVPGCSLGFSFNVTSQQCELTEEYMLIIIVCSSVGGGLLLILVVVLALILTFCICKRRQRRSKTLKTGVHLIRSTVREDTTEF